MQQILHELYERHQINTFRNPIHLLSTILRSLDDLRMKKIDVDEVTGRLFLSKNELSPTEFCIAKSVALLIQKLLDRPDACITSLNGGAVWGTSRGFGEVKCFSQAENKFAVAKDLIRLGHFSMNAIDIHNMNGVVGRHVFFYLTKLVHDGLYIMLEIDKIEVPASVYALPTYTTQAHRLLNVISIYQQCTPCSDVTKDMFVVTKTRDRKRATDTTYHHQ
ncbi:hypothetical protein BDB00DRAFT_880775 [Zychaea mexicana]|uniref:uncharacterized protein n=1 Tax=Zychaea mexicana TaxID=64656 RepID=UPI0022FE2CFE|nr:uncharacterized protein BDB00DRAFT_880775 [Zychaea mexicana]KAI9499489.1 hypothetical protein BDB00DRAFT_880775 [Zychaea mexicana]